MLFNSWQFAVFFPLVTLGFFTLPARLTVYWLLAASMLFYAAFIPSYLLILFAIILIDYTSAFFISAAPTRAAKRRWLSLSLLGNLGMLSLFKYFDFFSTNAGALANALGFPGTPPKLGWVLPLGLSFHTFQAVSYTIEVYRGRQPVERSLSRYALYVLFYPQLVAGPIERPQNLLHQFTAFRNFDYANFRAGLQLMAWGLFKKSIVADRLSDTVDAVFAHPDKFQGPETLLATAFFSFQIYCDFSGYSDMAIGAARVMGIDLMRNFRQPYLAQSFSEFWQRWHISLSSWFRDYVYIPLGGSRGNTPRTVFNIAAVFLLSGLWHGAAWTFVLWGALHALFRTAEYLAGYRPGPAPVPVAIARGIAVFTAVSIAWIPFRATALSATWTMYTALLSGWSLLLHPAALAKQLGAMELSASRLAINAVLIAILMTVDWLRDREIFRPWFESRPVWFRWAAYNTAVLVIGLLGVFTEKEFIYFQF